MKTYTFHFLKGQRHTQGLLVNKWMPLEGGMDKIEGDRHIYVIS